MSDGNLGEREINLRGNAIGKTRRSNIPGEPTEQHRREETTKNVARKRKNLQYAAMTREQQNWEGRTEKQKQGRRDRGRETGRTQGPKRGTDYKRQQKNNRRDTTEQRNRKTPEKAGARKLRSGNNRERAQARGTDPLQKTAKKKLGAQNEAAKSGDAVTPKRQRGKRNNKTTGREKPGRRRREDATGGTQRSERMGHLQKSQNRRTRRGNATE